MQLINNGYVVQDLNYLIFDQDSYNGVQKFKSWPLRKYNDNESLMLEDFAWKKWFAYHGCFETVPDVKFIKKYINHCNHLGIEIRLLQIESPTKYMETSNTLSIKKVLGFDCVAGIELSYLCMPNQDLKKFPKTFYMQKKHLNINNSLSSLALHCQQTLLLCYA